MEATKIGLKLEVKVRTDEKVKKLFVPGEFGAVLDWEVRDKNGIVIVHGIKKSESFVRQFMDLLLVKFWNLPESNIMQVRDIANTLQDICNSIQVFGCDAPIGDVNYGIIVGMGVGAPTITDYVIGAIIAHDAGAHGVNTMQYGAVTFGAPASDPTTSQFTITRNFANATVAAITVNEIALYVRALTPLCIAAAIGDNYAFRYFMTIRDVIAGGIVVGIGQTLTVNYRPQVVI